MLFHTTAAGNRKIHKYRLFFVAGLLNFVLLITFITLIANYVIVLGLQTIIFPQDIRIFRFRKSHFAEFVLKFSNRCFPNWYILNVCFISYDTHMNFVGLHRKGRKTKMINFIEEEKTFRPFRWLDFLIFAKVLCP